MSEENKKWRNDPNKIKELVDICGNCDSVWVFTKDFFFMQKR